MHDVKMGSTSMVAVGGILECSVGVNRWYNWVSG